MNFLRERSAYMRETVLGESLRKIEAEGLKAAPDHPRPGLGHPGPGRRLGWQMPVRLVRGGHRLSLGGDRVGQDQRQA